MPWQQGKERLMAQLGAEINKHFDLERAAVLREFAKQRFSNNHSEDYKSRQLSDIYGALLDDWDFIQERKPGKAKIRVFNPEYLKHGWQHSHTVVEILCEDMPFIRDSVRGELNRRNITIHTINSTTLTIIRDEQQLLHKLLNTEEKTKAFKDDKPVSETLLFLEIDRISDGERLRALSDSIAEILSEVKIVVDDFEAMAGRGQRALESVRKSSDLVVDREECAAFVAWLCANKFTFLGCEQLTVVYENENQIVSSVKDSGLGLLKLRSSNARVDLSSEIRNGGKKSLFENQLVFSKSSVRSRVHRFAYPDYIGIRSFDEQGRIVGEHRLLGLFTFGVYSLSPFDIPYIRKKVNAVMARSGLVLTSHAGKDLARVLEVFPRDELFQSSVDELFSTAIAVNNMQERRQVRLFVRRDIAGKFVNCLVYTPRDIYRTELRAKVEALLCDAFGAEESEFNTFFSESILTRTHIILRVNSAEQREVDFSALEEEVIKVTMSWPDHLSNHLIEEFGEEEGSSLIQHYANAFSPGYMDDFKPRAAVNDIQRIKNLLNSHVSSSDHLEMSFYRLSGEDHSTVRFRLIRLEKPIPLSDVMPILENLGLRVESEHPYDVKRDDGVKVWIHEYNLTHGLSSKIDFDLVGEVFKAAFTRIWNKDAESDSFNRLILGTSLGWREIAMLRAYSRYMKQIQFNFSGEYIADTLYNHLSITGKIVELFNWRFDPRLQMDGDINHADKSDREKQLEQSIVDDLDTVENLAEDRIIRQYLALINVTLRTNYFQKNIDGELKDYFSFKLCPSDIPDMPLPVPMFEIFVYSPRVEGVHLRGGKVARGGLRWSDRAEDFRTEVLGLVKAQQVKNAVIVPTGAKGGFIAKRLPLLNSRQAMQEEGINCYKIFIQALLDITDNLVGGNVVPPADVVRLDEDDTYLVVAADKGTATFSDIANELSLKSNFWLGDAFASGGSAGYDHKKMGITAKGAWVSVQRHFREMGINIQETDFTVVGVGDMGGDVFGNGMLLSEHIQLVCAFNHIHIFVDPNPDSSASFIERQRLFNLPGSSWSDYEKSLISKGGGIFLRSAKSIVISEEMKKRFNITSSKLTPVELMHAVLKAPADLFWNGGIGTYTKATKETHAEVGDKANDVLRVNASELKFKVIGEGGNLGMTQLSRVEYALNGGRLNTDFIDNAAGVDCSDHEVNIKILLNDVIANGDMTEKQRNILLEEMTDSISELVLDNNYKQTQAISLAEREVIIRTGEYKRFIQSMDTSGRLNRQLEFIPDDQELLERKSAGKGLTRPELSVLISYAKSQLKEEIVDSTVPDDAYMLNAVETAFPQRLRTEFNKNIHGHRLRREIIATQLANDMVNNMGLIYVNRMEQSTGANSSDIMRAYVTAREVFEMPAFMRQIEALDYKVDSQVQMELISQLIRLVRRTSRWFIRNRRGQIEPSVQIEYFKSKVAQLKQSLPDVINKKLKKELDKRCQYFVSKGVPAELASSVAAATEFYPFLGIIEAAQTMGESVERVAKMFFALSEKLELDWFAQQITGLKIDNYWQAMARESYRDDLEWQQRSLAVAAIRHICEKGDVDACVSRWLDQQKVMVDRWRAMLAELQKSETQEFAMYSVAIRELLDMAQSSKYEDIEIAG